MSDTMRAAVVRTFGRLPEIETVPIPEPGVGEVRVKVEACGVCHTDLHAVDGDWPIKPALPFIPGHEVVGVVDKLGPQVEGLKLGDRVGVPWLHDACGECEFCQTGWETLCERQHNTGYGVNGGFAEYVIANARFAPRIPLTASAAEIAPILCAGVTTYKGLKETEARPGEWVAIYGVGGLGHVALQYAKAMGLKVAAVDVGDDKLALAREEGAEAVIDGREGDPAAAIQRVTGGGAHGVLVTAVSPQAFTQAIASVRRRGVVALVGLPPGDFPTPIFDVVLKRITIRGSIVGGRRDLEEALSFAADGKVKASVHVHPLADAATVLGDLKAGRVTGRAVLKP